MALLKIFCVEHCKIKTQLSTHIQKLGIYILIKFTLLCIIMFDASNNFKCKILLTTTELFMHLKKKSLANNK